MSLAYLNGDFIAPQEAKVSVFDRGFLFGDGVYEVISVYQHQPFHFEAHWERLQQQLAFLNIPLSMNVSDARTIAQRLIEAEENPNQSLYWQITRGMSMPRQHTFNSDTSPTVFAYTQALMRPDWNRLQQGYKAITAPDSRWQHAGIKSTSLLANILLRQRAAVENAVDAILIRNGYALEGATSNLFVAQGNYVYTPPAGDTIVPGVTRDLVLECLASQNLKVVIDNIPEANLFQADEIWLTGSTKEILPITQVNDKTLGSGQSGPLWSSVFNSYRALTHHD